MGQTAFKLTSSFGKAVRPEATPKTGATQTRKIDSYEIEQCLGTGGMGTVYKARDEKLDRVVALKVMLKDLRSDPSILAAFRKEARAVAKLNHPNIAQIYSLGESNGKPYIVMEYVAGEHFDNLVFSPEPLDQAKVMKTGMEIASGLQVAADAGLVHGDIKPENIVFDDHGVPKLLDFGIASASNAKSTEIWGTPYYIAPEKLRRQRVDFRSDIYCLGATLYHALTKHPPFDGDDVRTVLRARLAGPPPPLSTHRPDIDPEVEKIVGRMLQSDPSDRYPTYGALIADIRAYLRRAAPTAVRMDSMFYDGEEPPKEPRTPFYRDVRSQMFFLLVLIALFPYVVFLYVRPMLFPARSSVPLVSADAPPTSVPGYPEEADVEIVPEESGGEPAESEDVTVQEPAEESAGAETVAGEPRTAAADLPVVSDPGKSGGADSGHSVADTSDAVEIAEPVPASVAPRTGGREGSAAPQSTHPAGSQARPTHEEVIDLTVSALNAEPVKWPTIKVTAIIGGGDEGGALVNGEVVAIGYQLDNGAVLRAIEPQSATFEYQGETKKIYVSKPPRQPKDSKEGKSR